MKKVLYSAIAALALVGAASADPVVGTWQTASGEDGGFLHVDIAPCGADFCGTIKSAFKEGGSPSLQYPHLGKSIIKKMQANGSGSYSGGTVWAPDVDKTYTSKMSLKGSKLTVKGCVAGGLICRGQDWKRVR